MKTFNPLMQSRALLTYVFPVLAGCTIFVAFERYNFFPALFLLPFFLDGIRSLPTRRKMGAYWLMALVTNIGGFHWIGIVATDYGGLPGIAAWGVVLFFSLFNNLNFLLWAYLERFFGERADPFWIALLFAVTEQLNPQVFPWYFGTSLDALPVFYQAADLLGVVGLSFIAMFLIHVPWWCWKHRHSLFSTHRGLLIAQAVLILLLVGYGTRRLRQFHNAPGAGRKSLTVSVIQSNTTMEKFYGASMSARERYREFQEILALSEKAVRANSGPTDLVIWPEGAVHFPILSYDVIREAIADFARRNRTHLVCGSGELGGRDEHGRTVYYNSLFYFNPEGEIAGKYHKIVLLAFGEYIPLLETFPVLEKWLPETISQFTRGTEKPVFALGSDLHWLPLICYEDIISGFIAGFDHHRADFMVNITNDGWFGKSFASHLHKQMARPRTVEYRKPIIRALNTGSSQIIDAAGRTISVETDLYKREFINLTLNVPEEPPLTLYAIWGNAPVYTAMFVVMLLWLKRKFCSAAIT